MTCDYESDGVIDREEVWTRDAEGVLLWYESREAGVVHTRADYGYADGLLVTEHWVHGWGTSDIAYTYDAERRLIEYVRDGDSSTEHILYFYDADGWLSRADYVYPDSAGELQVSHTERYEYDSEGRPLAWELDWYLDGSAVEWMYWTYETVPCCHVGCPRPGPVSSRTASSSTCRVGTRWLRRRHRPWCPPGSPRPPGTGMSTGGHSPSHTRCRRGN